MDGIASIHRLTAGESPEPKRRGGSVTVGHMNLTRHNAEDAAGDLRQHGLDALALRRRARGDQNFPRARNAQGHAFEGSAPSALDIIAETDADPAPLAPRLFLARGKIVPARGNKRAPLALRLVAAVLSNRAA